MTRACEFRPDVLYSLEEGPLSTRRQNSGKPRRGSEKTTRTAPSGRAVTPMQVTVTTIGTSAGIILPKAALQQLHAEKGQKLFVTEAPGGSLRLTKFNPDFERQMRYAYEAMDLFPDALKELAK
jgi:antitoxin component of MazEF toxin-antitoxin module